MWVALVRKQVEAAAGFAVNCPQIKGFKSESFLSKIAHCSILLVFALV